MDNDPRLKAFGLGMARMLLYGAELFSLSVFCSCLFLVPEPYLGMRGLYIAIAAVLAAGTAVAGGRLELVSSGRGTSSRRSIFTTIPIILSVVILGLAAFIFALSLLGMRR